MTKSEAIEKLRAYHKCQRLQVKGIYEDCNEKLCDNCDLCYAQGNTGEHIKSIEIAIQALEKQIPKKIIRRKATDEDVENELRDFITLHDEICCCPNCDDFIAVYDLKYCWECGQKLDWSDEE